MAPKSGYHVLEQRVAGEVAVLGIDRFELVNVDERRHEALTGAARPVHFALQLLEPHAAPARAGEFVGPGLLAVTRCLLAVTRRLLAVTRGELAIAGRPFSILLSALASLGRAAAKLLHSQGVLVIDSVAAGEVQRLTVGYLGRLVAKGCELVAVTGRVVTLLRCLVAKMCAIQPGERRTGSYGTGLRMRDRVTPVIAIPIGGRLVVV